MGVRSHAAMVALAVNLVMTSGCSDVTNGSIVFFGQMPEPDDRTGFIIADSSGSGFRFLTTSGFTDGASWSPDSKRIAFTKDSALYLINPDGSGLKKITTSGTVFPGKPSWSPDGKNLAFAAFAPTANGQAVQIFRIADDGTDLKQLTNDGNPAIEPSWSPDGARIAYSYSASESEIYAMSAADGSHKTNLSNNPATWDISPSWERNGIEMLYLRYTPGNENERSDLYRMAADGSNQTLIKSAADQLNVFVPSYAPDSSRIIFQGMAPRNSDPSYSVSIYTIKRDGTDLQKLIAWGYTPDWGAGVPRDPWEKLYDCPPFCTKPQPVPRWDPPPLRTVQLRPLSMP